MRGQATVEGKSGVNVEKSYIDPEEELERVGDGFRTLWVFPDWGDVHRVLYESFDNNLQWNGRGFVRKYGDGALYLTTPQWADRLPNIDRVILDKGFEKSLYVRKFLASNPDIKQAVVSLGVTEPEYEYDYNDDELWYD